MDINQISQLPAWVIVTALGVIVVGIIIAFKEGREISLWPPRVGPRPTTTTATPVLPSPSYLSEEDMQEIVKRVKKELDEYRAEEGITAEMLEPSLAALPERTINLFKMKVSIGRKIRELVLERMGGWAGSSMASLETFLNLAYEHHLISEGLAEDIQQFDRLIIPGIYGDFISTEQYFQASQLAGKILRQLDKLLSMVPAQVSDENKGLEKWEWNGKYSDEEMQVWLQRVLPVRLGLPSDGIEVEKVPSVDSDRYILHVDGDGDFGVEVRIVWNEREFSEQIRSLESFSKFGFVSEFQQYTGPGMIELVIVFIVTEEALAYEIAKKWKKNIFQKIEAFVVVGYWDGSIFNDVFTVGAFG